MLRYLRISVTTLSLLVCCLLILTWPRSYSVEDDFFFCISETAFGVGTSMGRISLSESDYELIAPGPWCDWNSRPIRKDDPEFSWEAPLSTGIEQVLTMLEGPDWWKTEPAYRDSWGFGIARDPDGGILSVTMPHWFPILLSATIAAVPWISSVRRFSLRTLLIAVTLLAILLGLAVATVC
jgi:hypothetical protein